MQGYISGASFAHSLVSHTHMQDIDRYLTTIDNMPEAVKNLKAWPPAYPCHAAPSDFQGRYESRVTVSAADGRSWDAVNIGQLGGLSELCSVEAVCP